jgi:hypothetical protein
MISNQGKSLEEAISLLLATLQLFQAYRKLNVILSGQTQRIRQQSLLCKIVLLVMSQPQL